MRDDHSYPIEKLVKQCLAVGDKVKITDGSAFTNIKGKKRYIINSYPEVTGSTEKIHEMIGEVIELGVDNWVLKSYADTYYLQDAVVRFGNAEYRTCSGFLQKQTEKPKFRVEAEMVITKYIDVEAWDEEQAKNIADKSNVGDFKESLVPHVFNMKKVEKL